MELKGFVRFFARLFVLSSLTVLVGCGSSPTEIVVLVDTNVPVPAGIDTITLKVTAPDGQVVSASADLASTPLPVSQSHIQKGSMPGPYRFEATGEKAGITLLSVARDANFVDGERRVLRLNLEQTCLAVTCTAPDTTCSAGTCSAIEVAVMESYDGKTRFYGSREAGVPDGAIPDASTTPDSCAPQTEICDGVDNDCDSKTD